MPVNSMSAGYPLQPENPTDYERYFLSYLALQNRGRADDYEYVMKLTSPPPEITSIAKPGQFKNIKVGVIGGGAAGMAAAFEMRKLGFDITIFEADDKRVGGRIYTYYFDEEKRYYGELGAMRIPVTHNTTWHYINLFKLDTRTFIQNNPNGYIYLRDVHARNDPEGLYVMRDIYPKYNLTQWERTTSWQQLEYCGIESHLLCADPVLRTEILKVKKEYNPYTLYWDSKNIRKMMEVAGLSQEAISLISNLSSLAGSFLYNDYIDFIQEDYTSDLSYLYEIVGGNVNLPLAFYKSFMGENTERVYKGIDKEQLGNILWKSGCPVTGIGMNDDTGRVKIYYDNRKSNETLSKEFDYIVCAIPFSALRTVKVNPPFSPGKMQAITEVNYSNSHKSLLFCRRRFWEEGGPNERIVGGASYTDLPANTLWYPSDHGELLDGNKSNAELPYNEPGVLIVYNHNLNATRLGNMPEDARFEEIKREVEEVHGLPEGYLDDIAIGLKTVSWNREPLFRGAFTFFTPEQKKLFSYVMKIPEYGNKVFFAGEHISAKHRWIQGALKSGMEAANQVANACVGKLRGSCVV